MALLLPVTAAFVALLILPGWSFFYDVIPKVVVALLGGAIAVLLPLRVPSPLPRKLKWLGMLAIAYAGVTLLATAFSTHPWISWFGGVWRRSGLIAEFALLILAVTAACQLASEPERRRTFLRVTVLAAIPVVVYGIAQYFGIDPFISPAAYHAGEGPFMIVRPPATLGHAAYFATYLMFVVFAAAALALSETNRWWRTAGVTICAIAIFAVVLSGTRAAVAGLAAGALFLAIRHTRAVLIGAVAVVVLIAAFYVSPLGARLRARVFWSSEDRLGGARLLLWRDTLRMSREHLLVGYGPETFAIEFPRHQSIELARAYPDFYHESAHNIFLDALVSKGMLGLLPLAALAALGLLAARGPMGGAFVAMLVSQQFTTFTIPTELFFFGCLALLVSDGKIDRIRTVRWWIPGSITAAGFAAFAIYLAAGDGLLGSARRALDRGDVEPAARNVARARDWHMSADIYFSRRFVAFAQPKSKPWFYAMGAAVHAPQSAEDRQNALLNLAAFYAIGNNSAATERSLREAIAFAPNWFKPHWVLARLLARDGRYAEAKAEALAAVQRDGGKNREVTETLQELSAR
jgi:O-antigen ligase